MIDYVTDDSSFAAELPDDRVQEPDATFDNCYYLEGAYYYMTAADDQE